jgi:hypothetical protein
MVDVTCNSTTHTEFIVVSTAKWLRESNVIRTYIVSFLDPPFEFSPVLAPHALRWYVLFPLWVLVLPLVTFC